MPLSSITEPAASERAEALTRIGPLHHATLTAVADALARLRYGAVHLTVHDGKVVQLDVTERQRFT